MAPYRAAIMNEDNGKFWYDSTQQGTKEDKNLKKDITKSLNLR